MPAVLFGSISTIADTSEFQRQAFNAAFEAHGLDWHWDRGEYRAMLSTSGGRGRIEQYADSLGQTVDASAVHETKSKLFRESLGTAGLRPRAGVVDTIKDARSNGWKIGLVTTTSRANISALLDALSPDVAAHDFDIIVDATCVERPKPDKAAYSFALQRLNETSGEAVAIEDNVEGVEAAEAAGLRCCAFPNENTSEHDFSAADRRVDALDGAALRQLTRER